MRVLLVDDEPLALRRLAMAFEDIGGVEVVGTASDGDSAADAIRALKPDIVILDVQMPGRSGMAVAAGLAAEDRPEIIFLTAFEQYAADAFEVEATDYLLKPVRLNRLKQAIDRARRRRGEKTIPGGGMPAVPERAAEAFLHLPDRHGGRRIYLSDIVWIEAAKDYALIHTPTRSHMVRITMAELDAQLDAAIMLRVHRSAFVRIGAVQKLTRPGKGLVSLVLAGDIDVQVGPSYFRKVQDVLADCEHA